MKKLGGVRRSQLITTYGVGSVVAVEDSSFMVMGIDRWQEEACTKIHEPRLERKLKVQAFMLPPALEEGRDIPVVRFPKKHYCPTCKKLDDHSFFTSFDRNSCNSCGDDSKLVPSRFVACCVRGHIEDFPYFEWVHVGRPKKESGNIKHRLTIESRGTYSSLKDIVISCSCGESRPMEGAFAKDALKGRKRCSGARPWLSDFSPEPCDETLRTLQRGASNVWFAIVDSSLSIPPWSEAAFALLNPHWQMLKHIPDNALRPVVEGMGILKRSNLTVEDLISVINQRRSGENQADDDEALRFQEYEALTRGQAERDRSQEFISIPAPAIHASVKKHFSMVMEVRRLREVRALRSFTRVLPPDSGNPHRAPICNDYPVWLPAIEVRGEGVFLQLNEERLREWEAEPAVEARATRVREAYLRHVAELKATPTKTITSRFILIHTLAHALITEWSLDSGYPAASLRERLYVSERMAGFLIYTATSDSAGSLGGVVAQSAPDKLAATVSGLKLRQAWCSSDPLCIDAIAQGVDSLNLSACHACTLLPEVSCEEMNLFLDRAYLVGTSGEPSLAFFREEV